MKPKLSKNLNEEFLRFIEHHPAKRFSMNLRKMVMEYMMCEGATENIYMTDLLYDLSALFELLDLIQTENENSQVRASSKSAQSQRLP